MVLRGGEQGIDGQSEALAGHFDVENLLARRSRGAKFRKGWARDFG